MGMAAATVWRATITSATRQKVRRYGPTANPIHARNPRPRGARAGSSGRNRRSSRAASAALSLVSMGSPLAAAAI